MLGMIDRNFSGRAIGAPFVLAAIVPQNEAPPQAPVMTSGGTHPQVLRFLRQQLDPLRL